MVTAVDILEIFSEAAARFGDVRRTVRAEGLTVYRVHKPQTPEVRKSCARRVREHYARRVRERLLRGERPRPGGHAPTVWLRVARELGIDLGL